MRAIGRTRENYIFAGLHTVARQTLFKMDEWLNELAYPRFKTPLSWIILGSSIQFGSFAEQLTSTAMGYTVILTEQEAYPILLLLSLEDAELIEVKLEMERERVDAMKYLMPSLELMNGLAWLAYGNFIEGFEAQMECHQKVLDYFNESWTWITAKVTKVLDGDTIYVDGVEASIRFSGIDCPEIWHKDDPGKPEDERYAAGRAAGQYTTDRLLGKQIKIKLYTKRDIYKRRIGKIYIGGKSFETELVREGHAKFKYYR